MKKALSCVAFALIATYSISAQTFEEQGARNLRESFQRALQQQDTQAYASLFADSGVWDGPLGQNAIGPVNIRNSVSLMFADFGALEMVEWTAKTLTPGVMLVDVYQRMKGREDIRDVPVALGSVGPPRGSSVRTTMIVRKEKEDDRWKIIAARVADLRIRNRR